MSNFDSLDFNLSFNNFDPSEIQVDETINAVFVVDVSPSITTYVKDLNFAFNDFTQTMQKSHVAEQLMVSLLEFNEQISVKSGFQPIKQVCTFRLWHCLIRRYLSRFTISHRLSPKS
jgi:hypothetical protein